MDVCKIDGCERPLRSLGWCDAHYYRWYRHRDPLSGPPLRARTPQEAMSLYTVQDGECTKWTSTIASGGYGMICVDGKQIPAHRYVWEVANGPIPSGMVVDHICWNRSCIEITHLRLATAQQNSAHLSGPHSDRRHKLPRGVYRNGSRFFARVRKDGVNHHLGTFDTPEAAAIAATSKRHELFGAFAGNG